MKTFSRVIRPTTIRTILTIALAHKWDNRQLDVKNAFLKGHLVEPVFMEQPLGFKDQGRPDYVCRLTRAIYALR